MLPPQKDLQEKDFIQDQLSKNPFPAWLWFFILACLIAIISGTGNWYSNFVNKKISESPFLQVTNRQFSIFLWQFPEHMRMNASTKTGYLPGFQYEGKPTLVLKESENFVLAPPEVIFLYHAWHRLLSHEFYFRPIPTDEFKEFLAYAEEWQPQNWAAAPQPYVLLVQELEKKPTAQDLNKLPEAELPLMVRQAFQGWKNYFMESAKINALQISNDDLRRFLKASPHYARNYWRNIVYKNYPNYLKGSNEHALADQNVDRDELAPFLRVAIYNFLQL
jgi:hypothetical protein